MTNQMILLYALEGVFLFGALTILAPFLLAGIISPIAATINVVKNIKRYCKHQPIIVEHDSGRTIYRPILNFFNHCFIILLYLILGLLVYQLWMTHGAQLIIHMPIYLSVLIGLMLGIWSYGKLNDYVETPSTTYPYIDKL